uniref:Uncharacterized protein n=1 Tax=Paramoeba aestuarina TaxID=180227 RepID=A0A7S4UQB9_9EUKA|mmetsp:Transcript_35827/g.55993  ORF Transcript_35827/g.55993 Transcript_35827/m.55993 type:complete len:221 (+) Transcript_35827:265-927(+)
MLNVSRDHSLPLHHLLYSPRYPCGPSLSLSPSPSLSLSPSVRMGSWFSSLFWPVDDEFTILMVGLDQAGKTTMLCKLKTGQIVMTTATVGFNMETIEYNNIKFVVRDVGGGEKVRPLWNKYFETCRGVVFVVDSADKERMKDVRTELQNMLQAEPLRGVPFLIFANKQDLPGAMNPKDLSKSLGLGGEAHKFHVQPSCTLNGNGLYEGLDWLAKSIQNQS